MTLNELMLEQEIEARHARLAGIELDAREDTATPRHGARSVFAGMLVRLGTRLDGAAEERAVRQLATKQEVHRAL